MIMLWITRNSRSMISKYFKITVRTIRIAQPLDERNKLDQKWKNYAATARNKNQKFIEPCLPFKDDVILCDYNSVYKNIYDKEKFLNS
jgi:hypothetical protein